MSSGTPRAWPAIKALFQAAVERPPAQRARFLAEACGDDPELRAEVASLLAAHEDERPFLEESPIPAAVHAFASGFDDNSEEPLAALEPESRLGRYEIVERLGIGGMGEVYRARDTRLDRFVALKIVHDSSPNRHPTEQVLREARAAAALNHPHICTIHEVGEVEGRPYLAMEYVAGRPLSSVIPPGGLPEADVLAYGAQIADALAHAHEHRVVHRDLKAANVVVTPQGRAKVLDFGLARRLPAAGVSGKPVSITPTWTIAGTPAYMAPELLRGHTADSRSDVWALGVLLYEMSAGTRPFTGATPFEVSAQILNGTPAPVPLRIPPCLRAIISRCLEPAAADRFQNGFEVKSALDASQRSAPTFRFPRVVPSRGSVVAAVAVFGLLLLGNNPTSGTSIAVLPFTILPGAEDVGFLSIGLPDTIISRLAVVGRTRVRPTRAVLAWEKQPVDPQDAGRTLGVEYVLAGTIQPAGAQIRVDTRLVRVTDGRSMWTRPYTLAATDLLKLQDDIARGVVDALALRIASPDRARVFGRYTHDSEAYALYMRGRSQLLRRREESTQAAVQSFEAALARDPNYVLAHAGVALASAQMRLFFAKEADVMTWHARAHQAARRALQLDPDLAESHEALAAVFRSTEFDWHSAIEEAGKALALNPNLDQPYLYRASAFSHLGLLDRVPPEARAALDINPTDAEALRVEGVTAMFAGRFDEAVALLEKAAGSSRQSAEWNLAHAYWYAGRRSDAEAMLRALRGNARSERRAQATLATFLAKRGEFAEARKLIAAVTDAAYKDHHVAYALGAAYAQLGQPAEALRWLNEARLGLPCYPWFDRDPLLEPLDSVPAFRQFMAELKQSWETNAARQEPRAGR